MERLQGVDQMRVRVGELPVARLARLIREISGCKVLGFDPERDAAVVHVTVRDGKDVGRFDLDLTDMGIEDEHLLRIILEQRLDGLREWAHWDEQERAHQEEHLGT